MKKAIVFYDGDCQMCLRWMRRAQKIYQNKPYEFVAFQTDQAQQALGIQKGEVPHEMKLIPLNGPIVGGADALILMCKDIWWLWLIFVVGQLSLMRLLFQKIYKRVAINRHCSTGSCKIDRQ